MKNKSEHPFRRKTLFSFLTIILFFSFFLSGVFIAEQNTRHLGFGENWSAISFYRQESGETGLELHLFDREYTVNLTVPTVFLERVGLSVNSFWENLLSLGNAQLKNIFK